ncbi:protein TCL1B2-like [Mus pahari]|uniref:protein TCL1B2-like n=1 Tax=Mus pahari TaxID=10093 RepID=UPI000A3098D7|nr:protein TCL1B2-like [Mus pahari]
MAAAVFYPPRPLPQVLVSIRQGIYEDEQHRLWRVAKLETCSHSPYCSRIGTCITVHLWQMTRFPEEPTLYSPMNYNSLPTMWRLESTNTYRGTDAMYWRLLSHSQFGVTEQLILMVVCG